MRAIFSFENGLPFAVKDPSGGRKLITNEMSRYDHVPEGAKRLKRFFTFLYGILGTRSLANDTYPVAITREAVRSGALILEKEKRHSFTIKKIMPQGTPLLYYSTRKNRGKLLVRRTFPNIHWLFPNGVKQPSGIRDFRWPADINKPVWQVPGFSLEQYEIPKAVWIATVQERLAIASETLEQKAERIIADICQLTHTRIELVTDAIALNKSLGNKCMNFENYDGYSTPSRDGQIKASFSDLIKIHMKFHRNSTNGEIPLQLARIFANSEAEEPREAPSVCPITYKAETTISLGEFRRRLWGEKVSNNPHDPIKYRWGEEKGSSSKARRCPVY